MDTKITSVGNVQVLAIPASGIANVKAPTQQELAAALNISKAIAWDSSTIPVASESDDNDDRSIMDRGNATTRGAESFDASLNLFYPKDNLDTTSDFGKAYQMFRTPRVDMYLITMVLQAPQYTPTHPVAGDWISIFRFISDGWTDDINNDTSDKYNISFLTQGDVAVYTQVKNTTPVTLTATGPTAISVGEHLPVRAVLGGKRATQVVSWASSAPAIASVSPNGVVTGIAAGTATITATHPAEGGTPGGGVSVTVS